MSGNRRNAMRYSMGRLLLAAVAVPGLVLAFVPAGCTSGDGPPDGLVRVYRSAAPVESPGVTPSPSRDPLAGASPDDGPAEVVIDREGGLYGPVRFSHRDHARMAHMGGGCGLCHHHAAGKEVRACGACHTAPLVRQARAMLGWKGAYHRQCLACHRDSGTGCDCLFCHQRKDAPGPAPGRGARTPVVLPATRVYKTSHDGGTSVTFDHESHKECGDCGDCHGGDRCSACHRSGSRRLSTPKADPHRRCSTCHGKGEDLEFDCSDCHAK